MPVQMSQSKTLKASPKVAENQYFHAKVTVACQYERIARLIKEKLSEEAAAKFKESCFGKLVYNSPNSQFCAQLVHQILLREADYGCADEMWFNLCGTTTCFGRREFCLVTGLAWGSLDEKYAEISSKEEQR